MEPSEFSNINLEPMTDQEIYQLYRNAWVSTLAGLWTAFGVSIDIKRLEIYSRALKEIPLEILEKTIDQVLREHHFSNIPTVAELYKIAQEIIGHNTFENWEPDKPMGFYLMPGGVIKPI